MKIKSIWYSTVVRCAIFIALPLLISILMYGRMRHVLRNYMEYQVREESSTLGDIASMRLTAQLKDLEQVAEYLQDGEVEEDQMESAIAHLLDKEGQISCGILRLDGSPVTGKALRPGEYPAIQNAFRGKSTVRYREEEGFLFTVPIYHGKNIKYALYEFYDVDVLFSNFEESCYNGQGQMTMADYSKQKMILVSENDGEVGTYFLREDVQTAIQKLNKRMGTDTSAAVYCKSDDSEDFLFVCETNQENLYLLGRIPYDVVAGKVSSFSLSALLVFGLLLILLFIGTVSTFSANAKARESDELREAKRIAEEASKSKSTFLANMSHELRTPINVILGMDEMILRECPGHDTREKAMDIKSAAQILLGLINDVLDFSKIESGNLKIIPVEYNFVALIRDLVLLSENRARQKSLDFELEVQPDLPIVLYGDDIHIRQIMINLLTNAVKYTPEGRVLLRLGGQRKGEDSIIIHCEVIDTGVGIKQEDIQRLFIPYSRIEEGQNRNVEGTGLGLSIIINLLRLMGSELKLSSVYGEGSRFYFDLEQKIVDDEPVGDIQKRLSDMIKEYEYRVSFVAPEARILMVDDNSMNRRLFVSLLKETEIPVTTVSSGEKSLELVQQEHYDIIFMDYLMPEMDGAETLRRFRKLERNLCKDTPVIALTANAFSGAREKYMEMGFDGFLAKPIVTEKLEAMIQELLPKEYIKDAPPRSYDNQENFSRGEGEGNHPDIDGVNWEFARLHIKDQELLMQSLEDFYKNIDMESRDISELAEGIDSEEGLDGYRIRVHALKGTSAMMGILSVSEQAKLLEYAAKAGRTDRIRAVNPVLLEELLKMKENMKPVFGGQEKEKENLSDGSVLLGFLDMLRFSMEQMDIGGTDMMMGQIQAFSYEPEIQKAIDRLAEKVAALDYDGAGEEIDSVTAALASHPC